MKDFPYNFHKFDFWGSCSPLWCFLNFFSNCPSIFLIKKYCSILLLIDVDHPVNPWTIPQPPILQIQTCSTSIHFLQYPIYFVLSRGANWWEGLTNWGGVGEVYRIWINRFNKTERMKSSDGNSEKSWEQPWVYLKT